MREVKHAEKTGMLAGRTAWRLAGHAGGVAHCIETHLPTTLASAGLETPWMESTSPPPVLVMLRAMAAMLSSSISAGRKSFLVNLIPQS